MKSLLRPALLLTLILLLASGCAARTAVPPAPEKGAREVRDTAPVEAPAAPGAGGVADGSAPLDTGRKIILTANLELVVKETESTVTAIKALVAAEGGFVAAANVWREENLVRAQLTLRVPAERMDPLLAEIKKLAVRVEREQSGGQDVTEEYIDLEARLRNLEATETELRELLKDVREKTGEAEQVMAVYRELTRVRGEIERIKGRMQYLDRSAELATVNLSLTERGPEPIGTPGWQPLQTARRALNALVQTLKLGVEVVIWVALFVLPLLAVPALVLWVVWRLTRRRRPQG